MTDLEICDFVTGEVLSAQEPFFMRHPQARVRHFYHDDTPSMTHQGHKDSCDINSIIRQYDRTGILPPVVSPQYGDVSNLNRPLAELIDDSRAVSAELSKAQAARVKKTADKQSSDLKELEELRKAKLAASSTVVVPAPSA